jgi:hypothetical protein
MHRQKDDSENCFMQKVMKLFFNQLVCPTMWLGGGEWEGRDDGGRGGGLSFLGPDGPDGGHTCHSSLISTTILHCSTKLLSILIVFNAADLSSF